MSRDYSPPRRRFMGTAAFVGNGANGWKWWMPPPGGAAGRMRLFYFAVMAQKLIIEATNGIETYLGRGTAAPAGGAAATNIVAENPADQATQVWVPTVYTGVTDPAFVAACHAIVGPLIVGAPATLALPQNRWVFVSEEYGNELWFDPATHYAVLWMDASATADTLISVTYGWEES